jgi:hypothetical protein
MKFQEQVTRNLEPLFLTRVMAWTVGALALLIPEGGRDRQSYSLTDAADANTGA